MVIGENAAGFESFEQGWGLGDIAVLARSEDDPEWPPSAIGGHVDLGG
jgi:hypothetical protein